MKRIYSIDFTRGVVMIIMALDHVRDMIHADSISQSPTNLQTTTPVLFFTRWITYLCAPIFVFLAGTSAYISLKNSNNFVESRNFLLKRGVYLVLLEFIVVNVGLFFDFGFHTLIFEVIAAIGFGFIMLSLLLKLPAKAICIVGLAIIFCHNLTALIPLAEASAIKKIVMAFFAPGAFQFANRVFIVAYPPIPWLGIMLTGFALGKLFELQQAKRRSLFIKIGLSILILFIIVRLTNIYGDSVPWAVQQQSIFTFLSFMNVTKYPPSLVFCLITLGTMFLILALGEGAKGTLINIASVYGRVPLFYFLVHFFLIHFILLAVLFLQGFHWSQLDFVSGTFGRPKNAESGLPLWAIYLLWIGVVAALYKPCLWFGKYKSQHTYWWLRYI